MCGDVSDGSRRSLEVGKAGRLAPSVQSAACSKSWSEPLHQSGLRSLLKMKYTADSTYRLGTCGGSTLRMVA